MKRVKFGVSGHFPEKAWREWPEIRWCILITFRTTELVRLCLRSVDFSNGLWCYFDLRVKFWVSRHFLENPLRKFLKFCMLMYPDHFQNWLDYGYIWSIFLILGLFRLSETHGKIWGFQAFWSCSVDFPHYGDPLADIGQNMWGFWRMCGSKCGGEGGGIFPTLCVECCLVLILALFWLSETGQIWGFRAFPGESMEGMAWNFARWWLVYGHVSWSRSELISLWTWSVDFSNFGAILT